MSPTARWWARRAAAAAAEPTLGAALLGRQWPRYALRRLRGFAVTRAAAIALHVVEALLVARTLAGEQLVLGLVLASAMPLVTGAWWGATEVLRQRVRAHHARGDHAGADVEVRTWLTWSVRFGALIVLAALAFAWGHRGSPVLACWGAVLIGRAGLDLPLRVWHARIGARRRVFRPMGLQLVVEAAGPVVIVLGARPLGPVVVLLAALTSTIAARAVTALVLARAYRQDGRPWPWPRLRAPGLPWLAVGWHALAGVALRLPAVLAIPLVLSPGLPPHVAVGVHLSLGALAAASGWPWAHYHDLLAVQSRPLHRLRAHLERVILVEAIVVGAVVGGLALALALALAPTSLPFRPEPGVFVLIPPRLPAARPFLWVLPLIAAGVALLSAAQAIAWVRGQRVVIVLGAVAVALAAAWAERLPRLVYGHGYVGEHPPRAVDPHHPRRHRRGPRAGDDRDLRLARAARTGGGTRRTAVARGPGGRGPPGRGGGGARARRRDRRARHRDAGRGRHVLGTRWPHAAGAGPAGGRGAAPCRRDRLGHARRAVATARRRVA
jgi:hypothetical protein